MSVLLLIFGTRNLLFFQQVFWQISLHRRLKHTTENWKLFNLGFPLKFPLCCHQGIKLLSPSKEAQIKTQRPPTTPSPQISYLCQLSQLSQSHSSMPQAHAGGKLHASHKSSQSVADRVHQIIRQVLRKKKQLSSGDNLLSSLYWITISLTQVYITCFSIY